MLQWVIIVIDNTHDMVHEHKNILKYYCIWDADNEQKEINNMKGNTQSL